MHTKVNCYKKCCNSVSNSRHLVCLKPSLKMVGDTSLWLRKAAHLDTVFFFLPASGKYDPYSLGQPETTFPCTVTLNNVVRNGTYAGIA